MKGVQLIIREKRESVLFLKKAEDCKHTLVIKHLGEDGL